MEIGIGIGVWILVSLVGAVVSLAALGFWIWMLVECLTKEPSQGNDKLIWALVIIFANWIGALLYFFVRRPERIRDFGA